MNTLKALLPCFPAPIKLTHPTNSLKLPTEKPPHYALISQNPSSYPLSIHQTASSIVTALRHAQKAGPALDHTIASFVHQAGGWSEYLAAAILAAVETALKAGGEMNEALQDAYSKACDAAKGIEGFAADHPIATAVFCSIVALGVLVLLAPYVPEALGFAELGPVEGSWAAAWQARYGATVPARSLFSFFQRLGMKWGSAVAV